MVFRTEGRTDSGRGKSASQFAVQPSDLSPLADVSGGSVEPESYIEDMLMILIAAALAGQPADVVTSFQPAQAGTPPVEWAKEPTQAQIAASVPDDGSGPHFAALSCHVRTDGSLADCTTQRGLTSPGGYAAAALSFAGQFRLANRSVPPTGTIITIVMRFGDL